MLKDFCINGRHYRICRQYVHSIPRNTYGRPIGNTAAEDVALRRITCALYREQLADWHSYWGDLPNKDTRYLFWDRAEHDAYSTVRNGGMR